MGANSARTKSWRPSAKAVWARCTAPATRAWAARSPIKVSSARFSERFELEAKAIAALNHRNICQLYDVGPNYLVIELIPGPTLAEKMPAGPIVVDEAIRIARQIADGIEAGEADRIAARSAVKAAEPRTTFGSCESLDFPIGILESQT